MDIQHFHNFVNVLLRKANGVADSTEGIDAIDHRFPALFPSHAQISQPILQLMRSATRHEWISYAQY